MNDHFVSQQLKKLRQITPNADWVSQQRQVIMAQVYNGQDPAESAISRWVNFWLSFKYAVSQPGVIVSAILTFVLLGGGTGSYLAGRNAKPGDSAYIAKQISERAQLLAVSFDRSEQNRLKLELASQRVTEMAEVGADQPQAAQISRAFKQTISEVKDKLPQTKATVAAAKTEQPAATAVTATKTDGTFSVAAGKDKAGALQINEPAATQTPRQIIEEAEKLFDSRQYSAAIDKLQTASQLMDSSESAK